MDAPSDIIQQFVTTWGMPHMDFFASRLNCQIANYVSWKPDPSAVHINAFTLNWGGGKLMYAFPPFALIGRILQKVACDKAEMILVYYFLALYNYNQSSTYR